MVPRLTDEGTSGTYFLQNIHRKNIAIFKPTDEEPFTPNNPKKYQGEFDSESFRKGILSGESAGREVAAYLLDSPEGYHSVPPTAFVEMCHTSYFKI